MGSGVSLDNRIPPEQEKPNVSVSGTVNQSQYNPILEKFLILRNRRNKKTDEIPLIPPV